MVFSETTNQSSSCLKKRGREMSSFTQSDLTASFHSKCWKMLQTRSVVERPTQWRKSKPMIESVFVCLCHCSRWVKIRVYRDSIYNTIISCQKSPKIWWEMWFLQLWSKWFCLIYMSALLSDGNVKLFCDHYNIIFETNWTKTRILQHFRFYYHIFSAICPRFFSQSKI